MRVFSRDKGRVLRYADCGSEKKQLLFPSFPKTSKKRSVIPMKKQLLSLTMTLMMFLSLPLPSLAGSTRDWNAVA